MLPKRLSSLIAAALQVGTHGIGAPELLATVNLPYKNRQNDPCSGQAKVYFKRLRDFSFKLTAHSMSKSYHHLRRTSIHANAARLMAEIV